MAMARHKRSRQKSKNGKNIGTAIDGEIDADTAVARLNEIKGENKWIGKTKSDGNVGAGAHYAG